MNFFLLKVSLLILTSTTCLASQCKNFLNAESRTLREKLRDRKENQRDVFQPLVERFSAVVLDSLNRSSFKLNKMLEHEISGMRQGYYGASLLTNSPAIQKQIEAVGISLLQEGEKTNPELIRFRNREIKKNNYYSEFFDDDLVQARHVIWRNEVQQGTVFRFMPTPVGLSSPELTVALVLTSSTLFNIFESVQKDFEADLLSVNNSNVPFGRRNGIEIQIESNAQTSGEFNPAFDALEEALISLHQFIVFLTSHPVDGMSDFDLVRALVSPINEHSHITPISLLTRKLPMGFIGPTFLRGHFFDHPMRKNERGLLVPNPAFSEFINRVDNKAKSHLGDLNSTSAYMREFSCMGCPMTLPSNDGFTGVDRLAEIYSVVFERVLDFLKL